MKLSVDAGAVAFQHIGQEHRVGQAVGNVVLTAQRVGYGVDIAHIGSGEGNARPIGGGEHIASGLIILAVPVSPLHVGKNQPGGFQSLLPGLTGGGTADIGFHRMGQSIHAGGGGEMGRQGEREPGVQHRILGDEDEIVHHILVLNLGVRNDGSQGGFAAGSGGGGNGNQSGKRTQNPQGTLELSQRGAGTSQPSPHSLGTVHGGAAANGNQGLAPVTPVQAQCLLYVDHRGIGSGLIIDRVGNVVFVQHRLQLGGNGAADDAGVGDNQHSADIFFLKHGAQFPTAVEHLRLPVGKHRQGGSKNGLDTAAVNGFDGIHRPS